MNELKSCPFCGRTPRITSFIRTPHHDGIVDSSITIECVCGAKMEKQHTEYPDGTKLHYSAIDMWNRRAEA